MLQTATGGDSGLLRTVSLTAPLETGEERELLHAKLIVIDHGRQGYVGSLNLTGSSMDEVIEVGIFVSGESALSLLELVEDVLAAAVTG
jgi:phosphatidylserine/phosphatidylglycerophosphate/cardiolipin synthase-like enzyme